METLEIALDENGNKVVVLPDIIFSNKQNIDWNAAQGIREMVGIASDKRFRENRKEKHSGDAANCWYYYTTRFAMPVYDNDVKTENYNIYSGCLVVNCTGKGKMYLYDLVDIKKEASNPLKTNR